MRQYKESDEGPGYEDGPWAEKWVERCGSKKMCPKCCESKIVDVEPTDYFGIVRRLKCVVCGTEWEI